MKIILGSGSPRRKWLLKSIVDDFEIVVPEEENLPIRDRALFLQKNTEGKEASVLAKRPDLVKEKLIITADTVLWFEGKAWGKPLDISDARRTISALSGKTHEVLSGVRLYLRGKQHFFMETTLVQFREITKTEVDRYIAECGETLLDKAGSYAVQGPGAWLIERIEGCYSNIIGLPVPRLAKEIKNFCENTSGKS